VSAPAPGGALLRLYGALLRLGAPGFVLHLLWRGLRNRDYWRRWGERFARRRALPAGPFDLWVHAVSVGEAQVGARLVRGLQRGRPGLRVLVTATTPTGSRRVRESLGDAVAHCYLPYDFPGAMARFLDRARPAAVVLVETELWPNLLEACARRGIPTMLANARLSARSAAGYGRLRPLMARMLGRLERVAAQSAADGERLVGLGLDPARLVITGSAKFDLELPASLVEQAQVLRRTLGVERAVWIAASTHEGEDEVVLDAFARVREADSQALLVLVPRHPERFPRVAALARRRGFATVLRSERPREVGDAAVYVGDTMGELPLLYAASDVAFVGGSLVPTGGHNMLEAAALGLPVVTGPHVFNFAEVSALLLARDGARRVRDAGELAQAVIALCADPNLRHRVGERGRQVVAENRGALDRLAREVEALLPPPASPSG
jgi:3-deoxy-D-manno-octulosonic-acid transferase